jgi:hypothetical protein
VEDAQKRSFKSLGSDLFSYGAYEMIMGLCSIMNMVDSEKILRLTFTLILYVHMHVGVGAKLKLGIEIKAGRDYYWYWRRGRSVTI